MPTLAPPKRMATTEDHLERLCAAGFITGLRRSISHETPVTTPGYTNKFPNASMSALPSSPPEYREGEGEGDDDVEELPPARFKVSPREEEGHEELPAYSCSLHKEMMFDRKMEMSSPFDRANGRSWKKVYAILHGTKLDVYKPKKTALFGGGYAPGELLDTYTLQLAEVGTAADYKKRQYVIRLRAQDQQFLLSCATFAPFLEWLEALSAAIDLSPSLEERSLPRHQTLPRRRRRRNQAAGAGTTGYSATITAGNASDRDAGENANGVYVEAAIAAAIETRRRLNNQPEEAAFDSDGKWCPRRRVTPEANVRYAKRCMAVLCADAPRQTDHVVVRGKRYRLAWAQRAMVPDNGPDEQQTKGKRPATSSGADPRLPKLPDYEEVAGIPTSPNPNPRPSEEERDVILPAIVC